jgi:hypothetical protein
VGGAAEVFVGRDMMGKALLEFSRVKKGVSTRDRSEVVRMSRIRILRLKVKHRKS